MARSDRQAAEKSLSQFPCSGNEYAAEQADELTASGQVIPADGKEFTRGLAPEKDEIDRIEQDETDWALAEVFETEGTEEPPAYTEKEEPLRR